MGSLCGVDVVGHANALRTSFDRRMFYREGGKYV